MPRPTRPGKASSPRRTKMRSTSGSPTLTYRAGDRLSSYTIPGWATSAAAMSSVCGATRAGASSGSKASTTAGGRSTASPSSRAFPGSNALAVYTRRLLRRGPDARRRPKAGGEAYSLYVEPAAEGAALPQMGPYRQPTLVERFADSLREVARVLIDGGRAETGVGHLVPQHLGEGGKLLRVGPGRGVPQARPEEGLRAVEVGLLDLDADPHLGQLAVHGRAREDLLVADDGGAPIDAERVPAPGHEEDQPHVRVLDDVTEPVDAIVPRAVGHHEVRLVQHQHEAGLVALGRHVTLPGGVRGREQEERRGGDEGTRVLVERRLALEHGALVGLSVERAQLLLRTHDVLEHGPTS